MTRLPWEGSYPVSQAFGNEDPLYTSYGLRGHNGVDYAVPSDTPLYAPADGEAVEVAYDAGWGYYVKLRTPSGEDWLIAHMNMWELPRPGTWLPEGDRIGFSDNTGTSTGPHVHVGYRLRWWVRGWPYNGYSTPPLPE